MSSIWKLLYVNRIGVCEASESKLRYLIGKGFIFGSLLPSGSRRRNYLGIKIVIKIRTNDIGFAIGSVIGCFRTNGLGIGIELLNLEVECGSEWAL